METEGYQLHESFTQSLLNDHFQSTQQAEHKLIQVTYASQETYRNCVRNLFLQMSGIAWLRTICIVTIFQMFDILST